MKKYMVRESQYKPLENKIIGLEPLGGKDPVAHMSDLKAMENRIINAIAVSLKPIVDRLDTIDNRLLNVESRLDRLEQRVVNIETEVKGIKTRIDNLVVLNNLKE